MIDVYERRTPDYDKNQEKMMRDYPCVICGREVKSGPRTRLVRLHYGGQMVVLPDEFEQAERDCPGGDLGAYPIGPDCLKKHPDMKPYVVA